MLTPINEIEIPLLAISPAMSKVCDQISLLANVNAPVLIIGEAGTGKEITARLIHRLSQRRDRPFRKVGCAATALEPLERDLLGSTERSFSASICERPGALEFCHGGVLFLEDVDDLPPSLQATLLRVMEEKQYFRPGTSTEVKVDVRILAGTKVALDGRAKNKLRPDFYFHMNTFSIHLPALRERREDIPLLLEHFMAQWALRYSRPAVPFPQHVLDACVTYSWPGNIIELENFVKRYLVIGDEALMLSDFGGKARHSRSAMGGSSSIDPGSPGQEQNLKHLVRRVKDKAEIEEITKALAETNWNRHAAARQLKISYRGLLYKIQHYQLRPPGQASQNHV